MTVAKLPSGEEIIVDTEDLNKIKVHRWLPNGLGYFVAQINGKRVRLHRLIMDAPAAQAYNEAAMVFFHEYASLNKVPKATRELREQILEKLSSFNGGFFYLGRIP